MARAIVIGGGVGGLAAAIRLRGLGHDVTVLERNELLGGKLAVREREGHLFDLGPSLVTLPHLYEACFATVGASLRDEIDLVRLDPQFRYHWRDGSSLEVPDSPEQTAMAFEAFVPGAGAAWQRFAARARDIWDVSERTFFAGPMANPLALMRRMRSPMDLARIDPFTTLADRARATFDDPRLAQWAGRYATYSGSSPFEVPATLACIVHVESHFGAWYPMGGLGTLCDAFVRVAQRAGAEVRTGSDVAEITTAGNRVTGVVLASGERLSADIVVANVDAEHLYGDLLDDQGALRKVRRAERSTSGFVIVAGVRGATPGLAHHNIWFGPDERREFTQLSAEQRFADEPTVYACVSSVTDPSQAPPGDENWFLLVNAPARPERTPEHYEQVVFDQLARHGVELRGRMDFHEIITPGDLMDRYRSPGGAIYGSSSNGRKAAFLRPGNRGPRRGLYLVGGSSHPGGGLPLVTKSAEIVAAMVEHDGW